MRSIRNPSAKDALPSACASSSINERGPGQLTDAELDQVTGAGTNPAAATMRAPILSSRSDNGSNEALRAAARAASGQIVGFVPYLDHAARSIG